MTWPDSLETGMSVLGRLPTLVDNGRGLAGLDDACSPRDLRLNLVLRRRSALAGSIIQ